MKYIIPFLFLLIGQHSWSQSFRFGLQGGVGTYSMEGLRGINDQVPMSIPFDTKLVADFPAYYYYRPTFLLVTDDYTLGLVNTFQSTGSRVSGKDYSGEYKFDMKVSAFAPGFYSEIQLLSGTKVRSSFYYILGCSFSRLTIGENFRVDETTVTDDQYKFKALNLFVEPGFNVSYPWQSFLLGLNGGYNVTFGKQAFYTDNIKSHTLSDPKSNKPIIPQWNGLRMGISVIYVLSKK